MAQRLLDRSWIALLVLAIGLVAACSSSSNDNKDDDGSAADVMSPG
jgi:uncharacterized lipoprotein